VPQEDPQYRRFRMDELRRLRGGPAPDEKPEGMVDYLVAKCKGDADLVLARCKEVLQVVLGQDPDHWPSLDHWKSLLPTWFVSRSSQSPGEDSEDDWSLDGWIPFFEDRMGQWWWWDAKVTNRDTLRVGVMILGWPYGGGELLWLLRAAGAVNADKEI
jgi:hypothetical protein